MKKTAFITLVFMSVSSMIFAQETPDKIFENENFNEIKINMTNLIGFKWLDVAFERTINEESSVGVGVLTNLGSNEGNGGLDEYRTFSLTTYYRQYFSKKYAQGFFVEGFTMLHSGRDDYYLNYDSITGSYINSNEKYTDLAVGISTGAKFVTKRGFVAEIYLGIGRDLLEQSDIEVVGRGGVSLGYRF